MTDKMMFETWARLLRPLFPHGAEFFFKPKRRLICIGWTQADELGRPNRSVRNVVIAFTHLAWKGCRGSRSARQARADLNLVALVQSSLSYCVGDESAYEFAGGELRIKVASVDLFPPPSGAAERTGQSLSAS